jgi:hypothetical protein
MELAPLPKIRVNSKLRYKNSAGIVTGCWWDDIAWRYEVYIGRGKNKGYWIVTEEGLLNGIN